MRYRERMVIASLRLHPDEVHRAETLELLRSVQGPVQASTGCLNCRICEEDGEGHPILFSECWETDDSLHQHVRSELFGRVLSAMDISGEAPEIHFYRVARVEGLDLIRRLRHVGLDTPFENAS